MRNLVPPSALQILEKTLDTVRIRANADGEVFGGEIMDAMREAGTAFGANRLEVLLIRTVLVRAMESLGESYPAEVLQNYENRMRVSEALKYLREAIEWTTRLQREPERVAV
jgi:phage-related minor tail protein